MRWYIRIPLSMILFLAVCAVSAYGSFIFLSKGLTVEVPDLTGRSHDNSELIIRELGLVLTVAGEQYDRTVPVGHVMKQDIQPGTHLHGQGEVAVILSKGPEVRLIPSVLEKTIQEARAVFMEKNLDVGRVLQVHSDSVPKGTVIAQLPAPEQWTGEAITLIVSEGPYEVTYYSPYFKGMLKQDALLIAADLGFSVRAKEFEGGNTVTQQSPAPGAEIARGGTLHLEIGGQ